MLTPLDCGIAVLENAMIHGDKIKLTDAELRALVKALRPLSPSVQEGERQLVELERMLDAVAEHRPDDGRFANAMEAFRIALRAALRSRAALEGR